MMSTWDTCPSAFALDDRQIHGAATQQGLGDSIGRHLAGCPRCAARLTTRDALDERFHAQFRDPLWQRVRTAPPRSWWRVGVLAPALAMVAAVAVLRVSAPSQPPARRPPEIGKDYRGAKGVPGIRVDGRRDGRVFAFDGATPARPRDEMQLTVAPARPEQRYVLVGSVDGTGRFSPFYPASLDGHSVALPAAGQPLLPPIVLDAAPGPERLIIVRSVRPLAVAVVAARAEQAAARLERFAVPGDDAAADVQWVTLQKDVPAERDPALP
jgi:hypothetical protein